MISLYLMCLIVMILSFLLVQKLKNKGRSFKSEDQEILDKYKATRPEQQFEKKQLLTQPEKLLFGILLELFEDKFIVCPQVAMGAILDVTDQAIRHKRLTTFAKNSGHAENMLRTEFNKKIIDFVLISKVTFQIICIIELDDSTHINKKDEDAQRDDKLLQAGYKVIRIPFKHISDLSKESVSHVITQKLTA